MSEFPILPIHTDRYIADTKHLTAEQHGAYFQLLMFMWRTRENGLDLDDDLRIARMISTSPRRWRKMKPILLAFFARHEDGLYRQKTLTEIRQKVALKVEKRREAGRKGGKASKLTPNGDEKRDLLDTQAVQTEAAKSLENNEEGQANGKQNESTKTKTKTKTTLTESITPLTPQGAREGRKAAGWPPDAWDQFIEAYPNKIGLGGSNGAKAHFATIAARYGDREDFADILAAVHRYAANPGTTKFMHPRTWLSEERWRDRPATPAAAEPPKPTRAVGGVDHILDRRRKNRHGNGTDHSLPDLAADHDGPTLDLTARDISEPDGTRAGSAGARQLRQKGRA